MEQRRLMDGKKTIARILGSGIYNLDTNVVREYPDGPGSRRFTETVLGDEVGGTCGNVMCLLSVLGLKAYPQACLDDSPEGMKMTEDMVSYHCDTRFVTKRVSQPNRSRSSVIRRPSGESSRHAWG